MLLSYPGDQVPSGFLDVPGDRRLKEETVVFQQVGTSLGAGADGELDFRVHLGDDVALVVLAPFAVDELLAVLDHLKMKAARLKWIVRLGVELFHRRRCAGMKQASAHRMLAIRLAVVAVAADATVVADVGHSRLGVEKGRRGQRRQRRAGWRGGRRRRRARPEQIRARAGTDRDYDRCQAPRRSTALPRGG
ncbi:MAG: hypothetical protein L0Y71_01895 [Gemmataceae bacterium]|nr:hypothetical protein [Gemmataceae bacterium]